MKSLMLTNQQAPPAPKPLSPEMQELLNQLKDIHEPAAIGWWPPAVGWWILTGVFIVLIFAAVLAALRIRKKRLANQYRSEGVHLLQAIDLNDPQAIEKINILLKRVAVVTFGRNTCAALTGESWINFIESSIDSPMPLPAKHALLDNLYSASTPAPEDLNSLLQFSINWVRNHQPQAHFQDQQNSVQSKSKPEAEVV